MAAIWKGSIQHLKAILWSIALVMLVASCATPAPATTQPPPSAQPPPQPTNEPAKQPSSGPSNLPTFQPSAEPTNQPTNQPSNPPTFQPSKDPTTQPTLYTYEVVATYPHDPNAFTQGLVYLDGVLYEGTGLNGRSSLRRVDLQSGRLLQGIALPPQLFGEGIAVLGDRIFQLTWQSQVGLVYDRESFELLKTFSYPGEGWGLTHDGQRLIMSDGTADIRFLDPETLQEEGRITVRDDSATGIGLVTWLNELEYVEGEIYANIWQTDRIARIDPESGRVTGWIDLSGLLSPADITQPVDVLNGIAYDDTGDRLFVTGKLWPKLFEIRLVALD